MKWRVLAVSKPVSRSVWMDNSYSALVFVCAPARAAGLREVWRGWESTAGGAAGGGRAPDTAAHHPCPDGAVETAGATSTSGIRHQLLCLHGNPQVVGLHESYRYKSQWSLDGCHTTAEKTVPLQICRKSLLCLPSAVECTAHLAIFFNILVSLFILFPLGANEDDWTQKRNGDHEA